MSSTAIDIAPRKVRVWDPFVRIFHWSVVGICLVNMTILEDGERLHQNLGYAVLALLAARVVWGIVGTRHARFSDFLRGPKGVLAHLDAMRQRREPRFLGHNPAAGAMIIALMLMLTAIGATGWMLTLNAFWGSGWLEELHEALANILVVMVAVHVAAAIYESLRHGENLIWSMITGTKRQ